MLTARTSETSAKLIRVSTGLVLSRSICGRSSTEISIGMFAPRHHSPWRRSWNGPARVASVRRKSCTRKSSRRSTVSEKYFFANIEKDWNHRAKDELAVLRSLGKPAPEIDGVDLDGRSMKLSDYRGKVVLLSFWATWCGPCMKMVPHEREIGKTFGRQAVRDRRGEWRRRSASRKSCRCRPWHDMAILSRQERTPEDLSRLACLGLADVLPDRPEGDHQKAVGRCSAGSS